MDVDNVILESLLEHPEEWEFPDDATRKFLKHRKSKFEIEFYSANNPAVFTPGWAKLHKFKDDNARLIYSAIILLKKEREDAAELDVENRILKLLGSKSKEENPEDPSESVVIILAAVAVVAALAVFGLILSLVI